MYLPKMKINSFNTTCVISSVEHNGEWRCHCNHLNESDTSCEDYDSRPGYV